MIVFSNSIVSPTTRDTYGAQTFPDTYPFVDKTAKLFLSRATSGLVANAQTCQTSLLSPPDDHIILETWSEVEDWLVTYNAYVVKIHIPRQFVVDDRHVNRAMIHVNENCVSSSTWNFTFLSFRKTSCIKNVIFHVAEFNDAFAVWCEPIKSCNAKATRHGTLLDSAHVASSWYDVAKYTGQYDKADAYLIDNTAIYVTSKPVVSFENGLTLRTEHGAADNKSDNIRLFPIAKILTIFASNNFWKKPRYKPCAEPNSDGCGSNGRGFVGADAYSNLMLVYIQPNGRQT